VGVTLAPAIEHEETFLPDGWEIKVAATTVDETEAPAARLIAVDETTGKVTAVVGVTGIVDHVQDLIEVGAYKDTLAKRRPKVCWAHDWEKPVGKVLRIEEWKPGDPRFAEVGATLDGKAWPAEAGALVAEMQFNMKSDRGKEAFAAVEFYSDSGECEWSIGWAPIPGKSLRRKDGVRVCKSIELFEVSPVLFGAAPLTRTLEVKSLDLSAATLSSMLAKAEAHANGEDGPDEAELHRLAMDEIDWAEVDAASGGTPAAATTTTAAPAKKSYTEQLLVSLGEDDFGALLDAVEVKAEGGADQNRGNAENLRRWYVHEGGAAEIRWGTPGDFGRCVKIAAKHMDPERAKGYCNLRHKDALGIYPATHAAMDRHKKALDAASGLAETWNPLLEVGTDAGYVEAKHLHGDGGLRGTYEERLDKIRSALSRRLMELNGWVEPDPDAEKRPAPMDCWVSVDGTYPDHVIATFVKYGPEDQRRSYDTPYAFVGGEVILGEPQQVELAIQVIPVAGGAEPTADDVENAVVLPAAVHLDQGISAVKGALTHLGLESKVGMVLSAANGSRLREAIRHLAQIAKAAGIDTGLVEDDGSRPPRAPGSTAPADNAPAVSPGTTAIGGKSDDGPVVLDQSDLMAALADL
jgi:hypothetical protein